MIQLKNGRNIQRLEVNMTYYILWDTDWEATNEAIEEQVARESYLQWLRDNEKRNCGAVSFQEKRNIGSKTVCSR